jgi:mono/diheme cytochrome c family protein
MSILKKRWILTGWFFCLVVLALLTFLGPGFSLRMNAQQQGTERGKYLVEEVAKCQECHTPRDDQGNLDMQAWMQGAPIWIKPTGHIANWADQVPALAGLPSFTDEQMERVLEKGVGPEGEALRPPMHIYHMNPADAKAIIAYLKSLPVQKH